MIGNCMKMVRIQLINQFKLNELKHGRPSKIILMVFAALCVVGVLSGYTVLLATGLAAVGLAEVILAYALTITSLVSLFFTIFKTNGILFVYKDYDMLMSLPITNVTLITSRFFSLYLMNTLFSALVTIPMGIVYCIHVNPSPVVYIMWILAALTQTLIPTVIGAAIGALIIALASRFKFANMVAIIVSVAALLCLYGIYVWAYGQQCESECGPADRSGRSPFLPDLPAVSGIKAVPWCYLAGKFPLYAGFHCNVSGHLWGVCGFGWVQIQCD